MSTPSCDWCPYPATWSLSGSYPAGIPGQVHPLWATYPASLAVACDRHLAAAMAADQNRPGATSGYLVLPLADGART